MRTLPVTLSACGPTCRCAWLAAVLLLFAVSNASFAQLLYVTNVGDRTISAYVIDQENGFLTELLPRVASPGTPTSVAVHPSRKFVYVTNGGAAAINAGPSLAVFSIDSNTGALTLAGSTPLVPGSSPQSVAIDPAGKFAFVAHQATNNVSVFSIDPSTGETTPVAGSPFATPAGPNCVVIHPTGKFAFVSTFGAGQVAAYSIDANGALTPLAGSPFAARNNLFWMTMDAAGKFLFVAERQDPGVLVYSVDDSTGALSPVAGSPFLARTGIGPTGVAVDPSGKFLFVSTVADGGVIRYNIGATGALTQGRSFGAVLGAFAVILDPSGKYLYVPGQQANAVAALAIDAGTGDLTQLQFFPAGIQPQRGAAILLDPPVLPPMSADSAFNAFSVAPRGMPNAGIAQGSQFSISGKNIGPVAGAHQEEFPLKTELAGVSIQIQFGDAATAAIMLEASIDFVTGIVPSTVPLGEATMTLTYKGRTTAPLPVTIVTISPGLSTRSGTGNGPTHDTRNANPDTVLVPAPIASLFEPRMPTNVLHRSAKPGQRVILEATGLGPASYDETQDSAQAFDVPAEVIVGNKLARVISKVRLSGYDFILLQLPDDVPEGCYVPVALRAGGVTSNVASISISSSGGSCSDPTGFAASDIDAAQASGQISMGTIGMSHFDLGPLGASDSANGIFASVDFNSLLRSFSRGNNGGGIRAAFASPPLGTCAVSSGKPTDPGDPWELPSDPTPLRYINVGQALNLNGPAGARQLPGPSYSYESEENVITPGDYSVDNGTGTQAVGPFKVALNVPPMLTWTNKDALASLDRTQDLTVTWSGGIADKEYVMIVGISSSDQATGGFLCAEKVSAGKFTVPAWVLSTLPASSTFTFGDQPLQGGLLGVGTAPLTNAVRFTTPGLNFGVFTYEQAVVSLVSFK